MGPPARWARALAGGDEEGLAEGVGVPGGAGAGREGDDRGGDSGRGGGVEEAVELDGAGEVFGGAGGEGAGGVALDVHGR